jgi:hypothetical protein
MPNDPNITPEEALDFVNSIIKRADDGDCYVGGVCPFYDVCSGDETCRSVRDFFVKKEVKP